MKFQSVAVYALAAIAMITGQSEARLRDGRRLWVKQAGSIIWNDINRGVANGECNGRCKDEMDDDESVGNMYPDGRGLPYPREPCEGVVCPAPAARICRFGEEPNCGCCGCSCYDFRTDTATYKAGDNGFNQRSVGDLNELDNEDETALANRQAWQVRLLARRDRLRKWRLAQLQARKPIREASPNRRLIVYGSRKKRRRRRRKKRRRL